MINAALTSMGAKRQATQQEVDGLVNAVDSSHDGKISKDELLVIFKKVTSTWYDGPNIIFKNLLLII